MTKQRTYCELMLSLNIYHNHIMTLEEVLNENVSIELKNKTIKRIELLDKATNIIIKLISKIEGEQNDIKRIPTKNT